LLGDHFNVRFRYCEHVAPSAYACSTTQLT
jgi:hypothetical protein